MKIKWTLLLIIVAGPLTGAYADDKEAAVSALEQNVKANPTNPELWLHLGFAYRKVDQMDQAQNAFQKVISLDPRNRDALFMLGLIYEKKHQAQDALNAWKQYLPLETDPAKRAVAEKHIHLLSQ